jgi:hypothetical protein
VGWILRDGENMVKQCTRPLHPQLPLRRKLGPDDSSRGPDARQKDFLAREIASYKNQRAAISRGKVYHIQPPALNGTEAIRSYDATTDSAIAVITRAESDGPIYIFHPKGLIPEQR